MVVESKVQDFYKKLEENVTSDKLIWFFSPKRYNGKEFSGNFNKKKFSIHLNSSTTYLRSIEITGIYQKKSTFTEIDYTIKNIISNKVMLIFSISSVVLINFFQIFKIFDFPQDEKINIIIVPFFIFIFLVHYFLDKIGKKIVKKKFEEIFKINKIL